MQAHEPVDQAHHRSTNSPCAAHRVLSQFRAGTVADVVNEIANAHGRIDVLVHAAGLEISKRLSDKELREYDLVFDVKSDGWFNLMRAIGDLHVGSTVAFSSVAGRFGNLGQTTTRRPTTCCANSPRTCAAAARARAAS